MVTSGEAPKRLDIFLVNREPKLSRSALQRLIGQGRVRVNGQVVKPSQKIKPSDDFVMDWRIGSPLLPLDETHKHIVRVGVSGFATTQFTRETGSNAALNTSFYRLFAIRQKFNYFYPDWKLKFLFRLQWEFDRRNTTEGMTYWFAISQWKKFPATRDR